MANKNQGFILVYTVLILSIMVIIGGVFAETVLKEVGISRDESESLKAFYAADTGVECVRFLQNEYSAFDTTSPQQTYSNACGTGEDVVAGLPSPSSQCTPHTYNFTLSGFSNGACTRIDVNVRPRQITVAGVPTLVCDIDVISNGKNTCGSTNRLVERTRWETL